MNGPAGLLDEVERQARLIALLRRRLAELQQDARATPPLMLSAAGILTERPAGSPRRQPAARPAEACWPAHPELPPLVAPAGVDRRRQTLAAVPMTVAFSLCGLSRERAVERLEAIAEQARDDERLRPLLLLDRADDLDLVRQRGWAVELIPPETPDAVDAALLGRRMEGIARQWAVVRLVDLGDRLLPWPAAERPSVAAPLRLVFFKDYGRLNPYQRRLYASLPGIAARPGTIQDALDDQDRCRPATVLFHLHWEEAVYREAVDEAAAQALTDAFVAAVDRFCKLGGRLVWTIHNLVPHENRFADVQAELWQALVRRADLVHVHGRFAEAAMRRAGVPPRRIVLAPHGNYLPAAKPTPKPRHRAEPAGVFRFGFIGAVRPYKSVDLLLQAFASVPGTSARLVIAGKGDAVLPQDGWPAALRGRIEIVDGWLDQERLEAVASRCDVIVLPYRRVTTSGSAMLALGLGVPVILPDLDDVGELVVHGRSGFRFRAGDVADLARVMREAVTMSLGAREAMRRAALVTARAHDWGWIGRRLAARMTAIARSGSPGAGQGEVPPAGSFDRAVEPASAVGQ